MTPDSSSNTPVKLKANCKVVNVTSAQIYPSKYLRMLTVGQKGCRRKDMVDTSFQAAVWADPGCTRPTMAHSGGRERKAMPSSKITQEIGVRRHQVILEDRNMVSRSSGSVHVTKDKQRAKVVKTLSNTCRTKKSRSMKSLQTRTSNLRGSRYRTVTSFLQK